jgi:hypothetical protein
VDPFFLDDLDQIKSLLRLKEISAGGPSEDLLNHSVGQARTTFWTELGTTLMTEINATPYTSSPSTDAEYRKVMAREVELDLVWFFLLEKMPSGFKAGQNEFVESWNTEGAFRNLSTREAERIRTATWQSPEMGIYRKMAILRGDLGVPTGVHINAALIEDDNETPELLYES